MVRAVVTWNQRFSMFSLPASPPVLGRYPDMPPSLESARAALHGITVHRAAAAPAQPVLSIVTVAFNAVDTLPRTIASIRAQSLSGIEYIVVDGGSTDGTLEVIRSADDLVSAWLSAPDRGISHAFNRGIALARGRYIALLNADDWMSPDQAQRAVKALEATDAGFVFGDLLYVTPDAPDVVDHRIHGDPGYAQSIHRTCPALNHPTVVVRREVYEHVGLFREMFHRAMDYDLLLRFHASGIRGVHVPEIVGYMSLGGASDEGWREGLDEVRRISTAFGRPAATAMATMLYCVVKGASRRMLLRVLPQGLYEALRRRINRQYAPTVDTE